MQDYAKLQNTNCCILKIKQHCCLFHLWLGLQKSKNIEQKISMGINDNLLEINPTEGSILILALV